MTFKLAKVGNHEQLWNSYGPTSADGMNQIITTQTQIVAGVIDTKYYTLLGQKLGDFLPIDVGQGADNLSLFQYTSAYIGSNFKSGLININNGLQKNASSNIQIGGFNIKNNFWRFDYQISQEALAVASKNAVAFSLIEAQEKARKKVWDLGLQEVLFKGLGDGETYGLLNQPNVTINTSLLPAKLTAMTAPQLRGFVSSVVETYLANNNGTQLPNRWAMPTNEFVTLGVPSNSTYPIKTIRDIVEEAFTQAGCVDFKIVHSKYAETADSTGALGRHVFYNADPESVKMFIPKDYTPSALFPLNGLDMISVAQGQFTGVVVFRPSEMLYADVQADVAPTEDSAATGSISISSSNASADDTVTVGNSVYTFKASLTPAAGEVKIGADAVASAANLADAINKDASNSGTTYAGATVKNTLATAVASAGASSSGVVSLTAIYVGESGNQIALSDTGTNITVTAFSGGSGTL